MNLKIPTSQSLHFSREQLTLIFSIKLARRIRKLLKESKLSDPADVARDGFDALMKGDDKVVSGFKNKVQSAMSNVMSDETLAAQMRNQSERSEKD